MAQGATQSKTPRIPPYLPFKTFLNSLDALSQGVPPKLDRSVWKSQSGFNQGLIMSAYRYFHLVTEKDDSTQDLAILAQHPEKRPTKMKELVEREYFFILEQSDITKATMKMVEDAFGDVYSITGDTRQKAISFFLKAAKFADLALSPYLITQLRESAKRPRRTKTRNGEPGAPPSATPAVHGTSVHKVQLASGGQLTIAISANPFTMPAEDRTFFFSLVDMLQKYGEQHPEAQQEETEEEEE
jgi:hypothetical protein